MRGLKRVFLAGGAGVTLMLSGETATLGVTDDGHLTIPTCNDHGLQIDFPAAGTAAQFRCGAELTSIDPQENTHVYDVTEESSAAVSGQLAGSIPPDIVENSLLRKPLNDLYKDATFKGTPQPDGNTYLLDIPDESRIHAKILMYICKRSDTFRGGVERCPVLISVPKKGETPIPPESDTGGGEQQQEDAIACRPGGKHQVTISTEKQDVRFKCGPPTNSLSPAQSVRVFDNENDKCNQQADLSTIVPEAKRSEADENGVYTVSFPRFPSSKKSLCYKCVSTSGGLSFPTTDCEVRIAVPGSTITSTLNPTTSGEENHLPTVVVSIAANAVIAGVAGMSCLA
ncbi:SAG-related sequence SRS37A [Besnoitia besnoiti]|uniref:SAG-related sequence SRS37A n=1 Tax=Besnoitia besnoiti TaxID=94643 RepID=A0A2A9M0S7_BESBE|nr:SAG-related sequence SRS37A [Besnoitia besnoiti]PFH31559.1 SAG-related sequence SRS37A [Besnoitia besnoiti]